MVNWEYCRIYIADYHDKWQIYGKQDYPTYLESRIILHALCVMYKQERPWLSNKSVQVGGTNNKRHNREKNTLSGTIQCICEMDILKDKIHHNTHKEYNIFYAREKNAFR